jgi:hypothetical protein
MSPSLAQTGRGLGLVQHNGIVRHAKVQATPHEKIEAELRTLLHVPGRPVISTLILKSCG